MISSNSSQYGQLYWYHSSLCSENLHVLKTN